MVKKTREIVGAIAAVVTFFAAWAYLWLVSEGWT